MRGILWNGKRLLRVRELLLPKDAGKLAESIRRLLLELTPRQPVPAGFSAPAEPNSPVSGIDLPRIASEYDARVDTRARCLARAEFTHGAACDIPDAVAVIAGTDLSWTFGVAEKIRNDPDPRPPETWEAEYRALRESGADDEALARFLAEHMERVARHYNPRALLVGGGVFGRKGFVRRFTRALRASGRREEVRPARLRRNGPAVGAALLHA